MAVEGTYTTYHHIFITTGVRFTHLYFFIIFIYLQTAQVNLHHRAFFFQFLF